MTWQSRPAWPENLFYWPIRRRIFRSPGHQCCAGPSSAKIPRLPWGPGLRITGPVRFPLGLSKFGSLLVIARNSTFSYQGQAIDIRTVARELGVRYILEGSIRRSGPRIRVSVQLIDAETGSHIWVEHYDRSLDDIFAVQDEMTAAIVGTIAPEIDQAEVNRVKRIPPESLDS